MLDEDQLKRAIAAMREAEKALLERKLARAEEKTTEARAALEEAVAGGRKSLEAKRTQRDFAGMKKDQDSTRTETQDIVKRLERRVPLVPSPDGKGPGRKEIASASKSMSGASGKLGGGKPGGASAEQEKALEDLDKGKKKVEEALEEIQRAFRDRLIAYLKERFQYALQEQRAITRETRSLDLKLRAIRLAAAGKSETIDVKDRQLSRRLAIREAKLTLITDDVLDLLTEDGTTMVFPEIVSEIHADLENAGGLLERIETGALTQSVQKDVEDAITEILAALEQAQKKPPPPSPNKGRESKSGAAPLLAKSSELKMVRALQLRVNKRTTGFDLGRRGEELSPGAKLQIEEIARKQKHVENLLRRVARSIGGR